MQGIVGRAWVKDVLLHNEHWRANVHLILQKANKLISQNTREFKAIKTLQIDESIVIMPQNVTVVMDQRNTIARCERCWTMKPTLVWVVSNVILPRKYRGKSNNWRLLKTETNWTMRLRENWNLHTLALLISNGYQRFTSRICYDHYNPRFNCQKDRRI